MANRIPLIVDTLDDNKIKELPAGDNLDLGNAGLTNVGSVNATDVTINGVSFNNPFSGNYNDLTNKPIIPVVPSAISAFANDSGYLVFGTNTDSIPEGITNLYHSTARVDARIQSANLSSLNNVDPVTSADDGKVVYYNHETQTFKFTNVVTESDNLQSILTRGNTSDKDIVTTGKVYFQNVFATVADLPNPSTYHGMFVHVHGNGKAYYSHAGEWKALQNEGENFTSFSVGADDSTLRSIGNGESFKISGGTGISTSSTAEGDITITLGNLTDLANVSAGAPTNGQALVWNNAQTRWEPGNVAGGISDIGDLGDVDVTVTTPVDNYVLSWDNGNSYWRPRALNNLDASTVTTQLDSTAANHYIPFVAAGSASQQVLRTDAGITYNPSTNVISLNTIVVTTTTQTSGLAVTGNITGTSSEVNFADAVRLQSGKELRLYDSANLKYNAFKSPASLTTNVTWTLPDGDGTTNQILKTDGSGNLAWVDNNAGGNAFSTIIVAGSNNVVADSANDTLTIVAGTNVTITTNDATDEITINASGGGGSGTPGGSDTQVQFNDGGTFGGESDLTYNKTTNTLTGVNLVATGKIEAPEIFSSSTGIPTITSASNIILDAANAVVLQKTVLRLGSYDTNGLATLTGQAGDVVYNSSEKQMQFWDGTAWQSSSDTFRFSVGADDSTLREVSNQESIKFIGGTNVTTSSDAEGNITINASGGGSYGDSNVDTHLNQSNPTSGHVLSWNGSDYAWVAQTSDYANGINVTDESSDTTCFPMFGTGATGALTVKTDQSAYTYNANTGTLSATAFVGDGSGLTGLSGINISSPNAGDMVYYNGSAWAATQGPVYYYTVTSNGASAYRFAGPGVGATTDNPNFTLYKGATYIFNNTTGSGHPFAIRVSSGGASFTEGVSGSTTGTQVFTVPHEPSDTTLVYQCTLHGGMVGNLTIV